MSNSDPTSAALQPRRGVHQLSQHHRRTLWVLWLVTVCLLLLSGWHVHGLVTKNLKDELQEQEQNLVNLTRVNQEHADRVFRNADQVIQFIESRYLEIGDRLDLMALAKQGVIDTGIFNQVGIIDAQGIYTLSNLPMTARLDLSDREHFKVHVAHDSGELFISKPVVGRASGKWSIQLTRRMNRPNGAFAGVVVVSIDPGYFSRFYNELELGGRGVMALYGMDRVARARKSGGRQEFGLQISDSPMFEGIARGQLTGTFTRVSQLDGVERLYHYRKLAHYAVAVVSGLDMPYLLAKHQATARALWGQAAVLSLVLIALAALLHRHLRHSNRAIVALDQSQQQVHERNDQLNAVFSLSPDAYVAFDSYYRTKFVSSNLALLMSDPKQGLEGLSEQEFSDWLLQHCEPGSSFTGIGAMRHQLQIDPTTAPTLLRIPNSGRRVLQVSLRTEAVGSIAQLMHFRDVTRETEVDRMKSDFLSTAAHELRTPIANVFGFSEVLLTQKHSAEESREFLEIIHTHAGLMASILNELLDLERIEARRGMDFNFAQVHLNELVRQSVQSFQSTLGSRAAPELQLPAEAIWVRTDAQKFQQVIANVLSNAYKYSPSDTPVRMDLGLEPDAAGQRRIRLRIRDLGIGMTVEQLARVGERFYRADTSGNIPGTGLGMSIVKEIIRLLGGSMGISSMPGQGTCVCLYLPLSVEPIVSGAMAQEQADHYTI